MLNPYDVLAFPAAPINLDFLLHFSVVIITIWSQAHAHSHPGFENVKLLCRSSRPGLLKRRKRYDQETWHALPGYSLAPIPSSPNPTSIQTIYSPTSFLINIRITNLHHNQASNNMNKAPSRKDNPVPDKPSPRDSVVLG